MATFVIDDLLLILYITFGMAVEGLIILVCYYLFNIDRKAWLLGKLSKKAYGVIEVTRKGNHVTQHLADFYEDHAVVKNGVFFLDPKRVYIRNNIRVIHYDESDAFTAITLARDEKDRLDGQIATHKKGWDSLTMKEKEFYENFTQGTDYSRLERVYLEPITMRVDIEDEDEKKLRDPEMIKQVFMKQKAIAENEAWNKFIQTIKIMLIAILVLALGAAILGYMNYDVLRHAPFIPTGGAPPFQ